MCAASLRFLLLHLDISSSQHDKNFMTLAVNVNARLGNQQLYKQIQQFILTHIQHTMVASRLSYVQYCYNVSDTTTDQQFYSTLLFLIFAALIFVSSTLFHVQTFIKP